MESPRYIVVMGVSGSGKSTVGRALAAKTGWSFIEGDDFHTDEHVNKMRAGVPLDDDDRWPWLRRIRAWIVSTERNGESAIISCSALRRAYRDLLRGDSVNVHFCCLKADEDVLRQRLAGRVQHNMSTSLLGSQLATLEPLHADEPGIDVSAHRPVEQIAGHIIDRLALPQLHDD